MAAYIPKKRKREHRTKPKRFGKDPFYNRMKWRQASKAMRGKYIICPVCEQRESKMTDHVISRPTGADYDTANLLPMCHQCHNIKRGIESHNDRLLIDTVQSSIEDDKLVPVDKTDIIQVINERRTTNNLHIFNNG